MGSFSRREWTTSRPPLAHLVHYPMATHAELAFCPDPGGLTGPHVPTWSSASRRCALRSTWVAGYLSTSTQPGYCDATRSVIVQAYTSPVMTMHQSCGDCRAPAPSTRRTDRSPFAYIHRYRCIVDDSAAPYRLAITAAPRGGTPLTTTATPHIGTPSAAQPDNTRQVGRRAPEDPHRDKLLSAPRGLR